MLKKYNPDSKHVIEYEPVELEADLSYVERPVEILDRREKVLRNKVVNLVRVLWRNPKVEESTWELESDMRENFDDSGNDRRVRAYSGCGSELFTGFTSSGGAGVWPNRRNEELAGRRVSSGFSGQTA
ncbi:hypothetical protein DCAR_0934780 [Daucus carota subsp. sativus]|uniref:Chromo domain-containing protein n=1 Tax=Daucus carota subsp. sativus TaxID=79200 RepID=A0AAF0XVZ6_DAUCS|nr:hypothetical protein DCAR_0934780 [Daucus carota subsp. sativus]